MPVRVTCPDCKKVHNLSDDMMGRNFRCGCDKVIKVGGAASARPAANTKQSVQKTQGSAAEVVLLAEEEWEEEEGEEPPAKKSAAAPRKGAPWILLPVVAFVFFLCGGGSGSLVSWLLMRSGSQVERTPQSSLNDPANPAAALNVAGGVKPAAPVPADRAAPAPRNPVAAAPPAANPIPPVANPFPAPAAPANPPAQAGGPFTLPGAPSGWVMMPDNVTLIVSIAHRAELIYFDTVADKESKHVSLEFKPAAMTLRGKSLLVVQKGASVLHVLDADSGKQSKEVRVPGEPLEQVACAPERGPVFVSNAKKEIFALDLATGTATKTTAMGQFLAVSPDGEFLYAGTQNPIRDQLVIRSNGAGSRVSLQKTGRHATIVKYAVKNSDTTAVAANGNVSINGSMMSLSADGKRIAMPGGGGWESGTERRRSYSIPIWDTKDMETMLGQVDLGIHPRNVAFHPVLNLGAADKSGETVMVFNGKSLAEVKSFKVTGRRGVFTPFLLTFGGKGTKVIYASSAMNNQPNQPGATPDQSPTQLNILPLDLNAEDRATLAQAYSQPGAPPQPVAKADDPAPPPSANPAAPAAPPAQAGGPFTLPGAPSGWVMMPDNVTLIVSIAHRAELIYFDTVADKEVKHVSLEFQPAAMALRGKSLLVVQKGASVLHVLDAASGKQSKEVRVPGEPLEQVACAPERGPVFVSNTKKEIFALSIEKGASLKTAAMGQFLAVSPDGKFLYAGTQNPIRDQLVIRRNGAGSRVSVQKTGLHATIVKYMVKNGETTPVAANGNVSINGVMMCLSADGKRIAMPGGGGWESLTEKRRSYSIPIWDSKDMETMIGQVELGIYPHNIAFHPVLNLGAADKGGETVVVFNGKSFAEVKSFKLPARRGVFTPFLLTFGGKGTKVIYASPSALNLPPQPGVNFDQNPTQLHFLPLELSAEDQAALAKAYGKP